MTTKKPKKRKTKKVERWWGVEQERRASSRVWTQRECCAEWTRWYARKLAGDLNVSGWHGTGWRVVRVEVQR